MERNEGIAKNYLNTPQFKETTNHLWSEITETLNEMGPPEKTTEGWKKVWKDFKYNVKSKLRKNKLSVTGTGGGPCKINQLTPLEDRVDRLLDLTTEINGYNIKKVGCPLLTDPVDSRNEIVDCPDIESVVIGTIDDFSIELNMPSPISHTTSIQSTNITPSVNRSITHQSVSIETPSTSRNINITQSGNPTNSHPPNRPAKVKETTKMLLKKQLEMQESFTKKTEKHQTEILRVLKDIRKIKENKFKFQKEKWIAKQQLLLEKNKLKSEELELKRLELELKERELN